jgi:hypothetical protein
MNFPQDQIDELKQMFPGVSYAAEGGFDYFLLPSVKLPGSCQPGQTDILLCPNVRDGYNSRLYFPDRIQCGKSPNWNGSTFIFDKQWHAFSWRLSQGLRLLQMVVSHLKGLQ